MSDVPSRVKNAVYLRAGGDDLHGLGPCCEACGGPIGTGIGALHHRLLRKHGGEHTAVNLLLVHGDLRVNCHNLTEYSIHQNPDRSYALGHLVRTGHDPAQHPVIVRRDLRDLRAAPFPEPDCTCRAA